MPRPPSDRRLRIGDAAVEIAADVGLHFVTHRAIDARLEYPMGTTSYYARTRRELLALAVNRLKDRLGAGMESLPFATVETDAEAVAVVIGLVELLCTASPEDQLARFALMVDQHADPEVLELLGPDSPIQENMRAFTAGVLQHVGIDDAEQNADALLALVDGLVFRRLVAKGSVDIPAAITVFWSGLPRTGNPSTAPLPPVSLVTGATIRA